jgi:hypothetical protein
MNRRQRRARGGGKPPSAKRGRPTNTSSVAIPVEATRAGAYDAWYETALGATAHRIELRLGSAPP